MSDLGDQSRNILVTLHKETGTHTIHNWPTLSYSKCTQLAQSMGQVGATDHRLIMKSHNDSGDAT